MAAFWAVFTFGGSGPALTAHGSLDLKQEIQIQTVQSWFEPANFLSLAHELTNCSNRALIQGHF
jgi:hypothetical protein